MQYNTSGLPTVLDWGIGQGQVRHTEFAYDPDGARVLKRDADQTIVTVGGLFERRTPAGTGVNDIHNLHNIVVDGRVVAQINRTQNASGGLNPVSGVTYLHNDLQGSIVALTNHNGEPIGDDDPSLRELFYDPFGRRIDAHNEPLDDSRRGGPRQGYTGHEHDDEFGLINMKGRIYDPEARRFLTPDPIQAPVSSQTYNRYSYVQNNPATLTDPTGYLPPTPDFLSRDNPLGDPLPRQPGFEKCFDPLTADDCGAGQAEPVEGDPFEHSSPELRARSALARAGLSATPTTTAAEPTPSSDDDTARPTVKVFILSAVFKADGPKLQVLAEVKRFLARLAFKLLETGLPFQEDMSRQGMAIGYDQEGKTEIMTKKQEMEKRAAPRPSTKGGKNVGPKIPGQRGFVRIVALTRIATAAAAALAAVAIYQGCKSGSCARGVADAALDAAGSPVNMTEFLEMSPSQRMELGETLRQEYLFERTGAGWY